MKLFSFYIPDETIQELEKMQEKEPEQTRSSLLRECIRLGLMQLKKIHRAKLKIENK